MIRNLVPMLAAASLFVTAGAEAADEPVGDTRLETADTMIRIGDVGGAAVCILALTGEVRGYDETWLRIGLAAGVGAVVTGIIGRRLKRNTERADRQHMVSVSLPASGRGVAGAWTIRW